ncbi:MAG TPA: acyltransferase [Acidimicrobiales bacterium]|jgi:peptidoglycan/LPS O-acetylase OafA/YrhL|nr:acyltransferase [Acidimicrobiales bacterium]
MDESPLIPAEPVRGTRQRLDHIDAMRPVKQAGVVSTHTLIAFAAVGTGITVGAALMLLHVTREAFLFVSACMLTYSFRDSMRVNLRSFATRRFLLVGVPYLCWTVIYFFFTLPNGTYSPSTAANHFFYLVGSGYYQLYYLVVLLEFYAIFPLLLLLLRKTVGHHGALLAASAALQLLLVSLMHWGVFPHWMRGFWASREVTSYQFYLIAGMVVALHLNEVHAWLVGHVRLVVGFTVASALLAEGWYYLAVYHVVSWFGSSSDPFQPIVIPFNIGAIASIYLIGVWLVDHRRTPRTRSLVQSGSDNSYGVYLAQMIFIVSLTWLGWRHVDKFVPWPIICIITLVFVFMACVGLTELLARTPLAKPLTGRSRIPWRSTPPSADPAPMTTPTPAPAEPVYVPVGVDVSAG